MSESQRLQEFEALRALSIILLLILHSDIFSLQVFGIEIGYAAAFVGAFLLGSFFFISGYFAALSIRKRGRNLIAFLYSKFIRIYPPYWLTLVLFIFILGYSLKRFDLVVYSLNLQFIFSPAFVKPLLTLWYISITAAYYVIFGILMTSTTSNLALFLWSAIVFIIGYIVHAYTSLFDGRFFEYYFIFLAGIYFSKFTQVRERLHAISLVPKLVFAVAGVCLFWLVQVAKFDVTNFFYLLGVDFYILSWVLMWLWIFRTSIGSWVIWTPISTAAFFAYLYHRPIWLMLTTLFNVEPGLTDILFKFLPGSFIVLIISYYFQRGYDLLLSVIGKRR